MIAVSCIFLWAALSLCLSIFGLLESFRPASLFAWGLLVPAATYTAVYAASTAFRGWILSIALRALTLGETPRILGGSFLLWKYSQGLLPASFGLPVGISDIVVAATAVPAAWFLVSSSGRPRHWFVSWQVFGLLWLLISSSLGMLTSPDAMHIFPMNLVPVFFGPLMILLHLAAISAALTSSRRTAARDRAGNRSRSVAGEEHPFAPGG
jgi:hypothetical protein